MSAARPSRGLRQRGEAARRAFIATLPLIAVAVAMHIGDSLLAEEGGESAFTFSEEGSIPTWITAALFLVAAGAGLRAALARADERMAWAAIALLMALFAAEEVALGLHEEAERLGPERLVLVLEVLLGATLALVLWPLASRLEPPAPELLLIAAGVLVVAQFAALLYDVLPDLGEAMNALVLAEEGGEMLVASLVFSAAASVIPWPEPA